LSGRELDRRARAARRFKKLRRGFWQFFSIGLASFATLGTPLLAFGPRLAPPVRIMLGFPLVIGFLAGCVGCLVTWAALMRFRCPSCGERFVLSSDSSWPTAACKHCGQYLG
jgi:predicted RNA-binding Zn-ribbon protein involved in translation (DUF1610 family)